MSALAGLPPWVAKRPCPPWCQVPTPHLFAPVPYGAGEFTRTHLLTRGGWEVSLFELFADGQFRAFDPRLRLTRDDDGLPVAALPELLTDLTSLADALGLADGGR